MEMGIIRKVISGSAAVATGGVSLAAIQFRSDTERAAYQTKKLRQAVERSNGSGFTEVPDFGAGGGVSNDVRPYLTASAVGGASIAAAGQSDAHSGPTGAQLNPGDSISPGWKPDPDDLTFEKFWNGTEWTSMRRARAI
jgi:hypothetical protein